MGMFDDIEFNYKMPDGYQGCDFLTKSLDCTGDGYRITPEGRLYRRYSSGYPDDVRLPLDDLAFDGELKIYTSESPPWYKYDLIFVQGNLSEIRCHQTGKRLVFEPASVPSLHCTIGASA